ncbi:MAG TPA: class I SAM-dependent methyltransferase [Micromonosporaceae bacterium]
MTKADPVARVAEVRRALVRDGPPWTRNDELDFEAVTMPERDCDLLRDLFIAEQVETVVEVGLAYGSSALAIGEALLTVAPPRPRHVIVDAFQDTIWSNVGWDLLRSAGLDAIATLITAPSSLALSNVVSDGLTADAAFVDGSHRFHEVFVDLYFLRKIVRAGGLVVLDDHWAPSVRAAVRYYERNLGWTPVPGAFDGGTVRAIGDAPAGAFDGGTVRATGDAPGRAFGDTPAAELVSRCVAFRLPDAAPEPDFLDFKPFCGGRAHG